MYSKIVACIILMFGLMYGEYYPIIFLHGHKSNPTDNEGWTTWGLSNSVMRRILNEQYAGYTAGEPLNCNENSTPQYTYGERRKIYNFSYYHPDGSPGVIGSGDSLVPFDNEYRINYDQSSQGGSWAQNLADFIDKVRYATGSNKVDIAAHSMGGLVAKSAIRYYGCENKVRKLLMLGTPNHGCHYPDLSYLPDWLVDWLGDDNPDWARYGELLELNVPYLLNGSYVDFYNRWAGETVAPWCSLLIRDFDWNCVEMATISGNRGSSYIAGDDDGTIAVDWVKQVNAVFNPTIYASHSYQNQMEIALTTCTYSIEFIKNWIIDDDVSHKGATYDVNCLLFPTPWYSYELRFWAPISNYSKALAMTAVLTTMAGQVYEETYKGYGIYKYSRNVPGTPVFATNPAQFSAGEYKLYYRVYDMNGLVVECPSKCKLVNSGENMPARVTIISPNGSENYGYEVCQIEWSCEFYYATTQKLYFSVDNGAHWSLIGPVAGDANVFDWYIPAGINSNQCRIKVAAYLDAMTITSDISNNCFTIDSRVTPYDLQALFVSESEVWLSWDCDGIINFEVQRMLKDTNIWKVIAQGYWGLPAELHDTDVKRGMTYYYRVRSYGVFQGETYYSNFSNTIEVHTPLLNRPWYQLRVHSPVSDRIVVKFRDLSNFETRFDVERKSPAIGENWHIEATLDAEPSSGTWVTYEDYNVEPESTYYYKVRAYTSVPPAGHSAYTWVYGATVFPHLRTSRDSATAFQPKIMYYHDDNFYYMSYAAESLIVASRSTDGLDMKRWQVLTLDIFKTNYALRTMSPWCYIWHYFNKITFFVALKLDVLNCTKYTPSET